MSDFEERARKAAEEARVAVNNSDVMSEDGERSARKRAARRAAIISSTTVIAIFALLGGVLVWNSQDDSDLVNGDSSTFSLAGALKPFDQCDAALDYFKQHAAEFYLRQYRQPLHGPAPTFADTREAMTDTAITTERSPSTTVEHSTTNVQEVGVDEPDIVKTDGKVILTVTNGMAKLLNANDGKPVVRSEFEAENVENAFLLGERVVLLSTFPRFRTLEFPSRNDVETKTTVSIYDITSIESPSLEGRFEATGAVVDARMVDSQVRLVGTYTPDVDTAPAFDDRGEINEQTKQSLQREIDASGIDKWLPTFKRFDAESKEVDSGRLVDCNQLGHPDSFSGLSTITLMTFDANKKLDDWKTAGVVAGGQTVYSSVQNTYVSSTKFSMDGATPDSTDVHSFSVANDGGVKYRGSGFVKGTLLDQYSMSEHNDTLRIATTISERRGWINSRSANQGQVAALQLQDNRLIQVGKVDGLGAQDNEQIKSVRFVGERGYVTTFRQTDPFYVIDLRDPKDLKVSGELKIPGFSSYLHPITDSLILGVGQTGEPRGATVVEFSLFDVSDPANPKKVDSKTFGAGTAGAQVDPKAFLYYPPKDLIVSPLNTYSDNWHGSVLLRVQDGKLVEIGRLRQVDNQLFSVLRSFVIGDYLYQLSPSALQVNNLTTHQDVARVSL